MKKCKGLASKNPLVIDGTLRHLYL
jgi:hypothetical protein